MRGSQFNRLEFREISPPGLRGTPDFLPGDFRKKSPKFCSRCILATLCARDLAKPVTLPVKAESVRRLANFCYTGYLKVSVENLEQDIKAAKALESEFVLNAVQKWVTENVKQV